MCNSQIPGCQFAVSKDGKLVYSRGFGFACREKKTAVEPRHLFRIASVSKSLTAVGVMKLVESGSVNLDDRAFAILHKLAPSKKNVVDSRIFDITVRNLLEHSAGFTKDDRDPTVEYLRIAADRFKRPRPADAKTIIRYTAFQPLKFEPGSTGSYANVGYSILGRIIEEITGVPYERYMQDEVFRVAGMTSMKLGRTKLVDQHPEEVYYFDADGDYILDSYSLFDDEPYPVPLSYGAKYYLEALDACGGWTATATDLVKFICSIDGRSQRPQILKEETIKAMTERPAFEPADSEQYYAKGWVIHPGKDKWFNFGGMEYGTSSGIFRLPNGVNAAFLANHVRNDRLIFANMADLTWKISQRSQWPEIDLFNRAVLS